jgi:hypothetical protein
MTPCELLDIEDAIVRACGEHESDHGKDRDYRRCVITQGFFVKFDSYKFLYPQVETQNYVSQLAEFDDSAPRVPKVLHFFHRDRLMAYVVMEYIKPTRSSVPDLPQRVALALQWLHDLVAPPSMSGLDL